MNIYFFLFSSKPTFLLASNQAQLVVLLTFFLGTGNEGWYQLIWLQDGNGAVIIHHLSLFIQTITYCFMGASKVLHVLRHIHFISCVNWHETQHVNILLNSSSLWTELWNEPTLIHYATMRLSSAILLCSYITHSPSKILSELIWHT